MHTSVAMVMKSLRNLATGCDDVMDFLFYHFPTCDPQQIQTKIEHLRVHVTLDTTDVGYNTECKQVVCAWWWCEIARRAKLVGNGWKIVEEICSK